eukprot:6182309-Pleurochrysis_carterae.AAC.2
MPPKQKPLHAVCRFRTKCAARLFCSGVAAVRGHAAPADRVCARASRPLACPKMLRRVRMSAPAHEA